MLLAQHMEQEFDVLDLIEIGEPIESITAPNCHGDLSRTVPGKLPHTLPHTLPDTLPVIMTQPTKTLLSKTAEAEIIHAPDNNMKLISPWYYPTCFDVALRDGEAMDCSED